jgi:hypothetical protein
MDLDMGHVRLSARRLRDGLIMIVAMAALGPGAATASAATTTASTSTLCSGTLSRPFSPWSDTNLYTPAPGGDFETATSGWSLSGGAAVSSGSETFGATGAVGTRSLSVPVGGTAVSPDVCIDPTRETFRFFARNNSTSTSAKLKVEILYPTKSGTWKVILGGILDTAKVQGWQVSPVYSNSSNLALLSGMANPPVRYRFTADGGGWQVDDVYVDPYRRT